MEHDLIFIDSNFGISNVVNAHPVLIYKNYRYWWAKVNKDKSFRFVCSDTECYASIKMKDNLIVKMRGRHYHDTLTKAQVASLRATQELKKEVISDITKSIQSCYNQTQMKLLQSNLSERSIASHFPGFIKFSSLLHKRRAKKLPTVPSNFFELQISGEYALTVKNEQFLRYDNKKPNQRVFIFIDDRLLEILSESDEWYMDGTFKSAPLQLTQLFTSHAAVKDASTYTTVPCAFILSVKKDEKTYREVFGVIKDLALQKNLTLNPKKIMADFEKASTNAIKYHFPNIIVKGCWLHFRQAIFRQAVKLDLKQHYHKDEYKEFINLLGSLSLIPVSMVNEGFNIVKDFMPNDSKCMDLYEYFDRQWIRNTELSHWNHFDSFVKTNNRIEGFHSGLNKMVINQHPNIFHLINHLKLQQALTLLNYSRLKLGQKINETSKKDKEKELNLELIKTQYRDSADLKHFMLALCQFIRYPYEYWFDSNDISLFFESETIDSTTGTNDFVPETSGSSTSTNDFVPETSGSSTSSFINLETVTFIPEPVTIVPPVRIRSTKSIRDLNLDELDDVEGINYVRSLMNTEALDTMSAAKKAEAERKKHLIEEQLSSLSKEQIDDEVKRMWRLSGKLDRIRISKRVKVSRLINRLRPLSL